MRDQMKLIFIILCLGLSLTGLSSSVQKLSVRRILDKVTEAYFKNGISSVPHHLSDDEDEDEESVYRFDYFLTSSDSDFMTENANGLGKYLKIMGYFRAPKLFDCIGKSKVFLAFMNRSDFEEGEGSYFLNKESYVSLLMALDLGVTVKVIVPLTDLSLIVSDLLPKMRSSLRTRLTKDHFIGLYLAHDDYELLKVGVDSITESLEKVPLKKGL